MKTAALAVLLLALLAAPAAAESSFGIAWDLGLPTGDTNDFAGGLSARGFSMEMRNYVRPDLALGGSFGWNVFNDEFAGTVSDGVVSITGKRWNYINAVPLQATAYKYFSNDRRSMRLFAGLGAGATWIETRIDVGGFTLQDQSWHFSLAPEVGVQLPWSSFVGYLAVRYQHAFAAGDAGAQGWFDFKVGFGLD